MKAPRRRRPLRRSIDCPLSGPDRTELARRVTYVGSPEHKDTPSFAGNPRPRADASICDRSLAARQDEITGWLRTAIEQGVFGANADGGFPRYAWYRDGAVVYEARLVNSGLGQYKGYPLNRDEWPEGIDAHYE